VECLPAYQHHRSTRHWPFSNPSCHVSFGTRVLDTPLGVCEPSLAKGLVRVRQPVHPYGTARPFSFAHSSTADCRQSRGASGRTKARFENTCQVPSAENDRLPARCV